MFINALEAKHTELELIFCIITLVDMTLISVTGDFLRCSI